MKRLFESVKYYNIDFWGEGFLQEIENIHKEKEKSGIRTA